MVFLISVFSLLGAVCVKEPRSSSGETSIFKALEEEWEPKFKELGLNFQRRFKDETRGSGKKRHTTTYRWIEISYADKRPRRDPEGDPDGEDCATQCLGFLIVIFVFCMFIGTLYGAFGFSLNLTELSDYYDEQPGTCSYGANRDPSVNPVLPLQPSARALLNYRCDKSQNSKCVKFVGSSKSRRCDQREYWDVWKLSFTNVHFEPEEGSAPDASNSRCDLQTAELRNETTCDEYGRAGRQKTDCFTSSSKANVCVAGDRNSKWYVWGMFMWSLFSVLCLGTSCCSGFCVCMSVIFCEEQYEACKVTFWRMLCRSKEDCDDSDTEEDETNDMGDLSGEETNETNEVAAEVQLPGATEVAAKDFQKFNGYLSDGGDLATETLTVEEAIRKAAGLAGCKGFCFAGEDSGGDPIYTPTPGLGLEKIGK